MTKITSLALIYIVLFPLADNLIIKILIILLWSFNFLWKYFKKKSPQYINVLEVSRYIVFAVSHRLAFPIILRFTAQSNILQLFKMWNQMI